MFCTIKSYKFQLKLYIHTEWQRGGVGLCLRPLTGFVEPCKIVLLHYIQCVSSTSKWPAGLKLCSFSKQGWYTSHKATHLCNVFMVSLINSVFSDFQSKILQQSDSVSVFLHCKGGSDLVCILPVFCPCNIQYVLLTGCSSPLRLSKETLSMDTQRFHIKHAVKKPV